jgi:ABC-type multidrug transport system ATPase subunit
MSELAIASKGLAKTYGSIQAVNGINLRVPRGAIYGFLGRNGAGKTTTIKMLLGLTRPTSGAAQVFGMDVSNRAHGHSSANRLRQREEDALSIIDSHRTGAIQPWLLPDMVR